MNSIFAASVVQIIILLAGKCEMASLNPKTAAEFQTALDNAKAGDSITLLPIDYVGNFHISSSGEKGNSIHIEGTQEVDSNGENKNTVLTSDSGIIFDIAASFVHLDNLSLSKGDIAVQIKGDHNKFKNLNLPNGIKKGFVVSGDNNELDHINLESSDIGIEIKSGHGNDIINDNFSSLTIAAEASDGKIQHVAIRKELLLHGSKYKIDSVTVEGDVDIQGCDNEMESTVFSGTSHIAKCNNFVSGSNVISNLED